MWSSAAWSWVSGRFVRLFHCWSLVGPVAGGAGGDQAAGGSWTAVNSRCQDGCHGQSRGKCRVSRRAERASRAGTRISWARTVAVVALACSSDASAPAARVRLKAMAASTSQALFTANDPDGRCQRSVLQVRVHLLDDGVPAVLRLGLQQRQRAVGEAGVVAVGG